MSHSSINLSDFILSLVLLFLCLILSANHRLNWLTSTLSFALTPLRSPIISFNSSLNQQLSPLRDLPAQQRLISDLRRQNAQLSLLSNKTTQLQAENDTLRNSLNTPVLSNRRLLPTKLTSLTRYATIDKGSKEGVIVGLPVTIDGALLGIIKSTSSYSSSVTLLTDPDLSLPVHTLSGLSGILTFQQNTLGITQLSSQATLNPDEPIFTIASDTIPEGLLIGKVKSIKTDQSSVYQSAVITPTLNPRIQQNALVLLP